MVVEEGVPWFFLPADDRPMHSLELVGHCWQERCSAMGFAERMAALGYPVPVDSRHGFADE
jgi:hypothetical protein